jgi:hypothetical protein
MSVLRWLFPYALGNFRPMDHDRIAYIITRNGVCCAKDLQSLDEPLELSSGLLNLKGTHYHMQSCFC